MNNALNGLKAALAAVAVLAVSACASWHPRPVTQDTGAARAPRARAPVPGAPRAPPPVTDLISSSVPSWFGYADRAGSDPAAREEASERDFQFLTRKGLQRIVLPRQLSADRFPVQVDDLLGENALQLECEGAGCAGLVMSVVSPDGRGIPVQVDQRLAYPVLWIKNPTMYRHSVQLDIDPRSTRGLPMQLKLSQWRFYLWAR